MPDYDGRPEEPSDAGDALLWVPRVLAFVPYVTWEYVIRRPMGWLVVTAERDDWPTKILDFFTFGEDRKVGLVPTAFFDFGFNPSVGLYFFADDVGAPGNDIRTNIGFWGVDWLKFSARDRVELGEGSFVQIGGGWLRRPDYLFHGIGPRSLDADSSRYGADEARGFLGYDLSLWRRSGLRTEVGVRDMSFRGTGWGEEPGVSTRALMGTYELPEGFERGYTAGYARMEAALDTRFAPPHPGDGLRVEGAVERGGELNPDRPANQWVKYGGKVGGFVDVTGHGRVISLRLSADFVEGVGEADQVPFTEFVFLGGSGEMRGFREGRLIGQSAVVATLQYEWPLWVWLNGHVHVATGNVFSRHLEDYDSRLLRLSSAIGLRSIGSTDHYLEMLAGVGTETYEEGWDVTSFRFVVGGNSGF